MKGLIFSAILFCFAIAANAQQPKRSKPAQPQAKPSAATKPAQRGSTLSGRVIDDGGRPVEGAMVMVAPAGTLSRQKRPADGGIRTATTGEDGRFNFEDLTVRSYVFRVFAPGYVLAPDIAQTNGRPVYYHLGDNVSLRLIKGAVITGMVVSPAGEPLVGIQVRATKIKEVDGRAARSAPIDETSIGRNWKTDDRGIYRIYGLEPGVYVVAAGGRGFLSFSLGAYDTDAPTYYPTGTRDTATPITLQAGQEIPGINIQYRDNRGHLVSGTLSGLGANSAAFITLTNAVNGNVESMTYGGSMFVMNDGDKPSFALSSVPDGEYYVSAMGGDGAKSNMATDEALIAPPRKVTVRGADVTGLELALTRLGSISGRFVLENAKTIDGKNLCQPKRNAAIEEVVLLSQLDVKGKGKTEQSIPIASLFSMFTTDSVPNDKGEFQVFTIDSGRYRLDMKLPTDDWYIRSLTLPAMATSENKETTLVQAKEAADSQAKPESSKPKDVARDGIAMKAGERLEGVIITASEGAAGLKGKVTAEKEGDPLPARLRIILVPAEPESADDVVRFYEVEMQRDATFSISNLAPGKYFMVTSPVSEEEMNEETLRPLGWDLDARKTLRKETEALTVTLDLQPCQRIGEYVLKHRSKAQIKKVGEGNRSLFE